MVDQIPGQADQINYEEDRKRFSLKERGRKRNGRT